MPAKNSAKAVKLEYKPKAVKPVGLPGKRVAKSAGKPVAFDQALADELCGLIAEGIPLREICRMERMPAWWNAYEWMKVNTNFAQHFARVREIGFDAIAQQSLDIVDAEPERTMTGQIDAASVARAKLRAEHRLKLLAKWSPKRYGEKVEQTVVGADGGPVSHSMTVEFVKTT